jgi:hypothetical protein
MASSTSALVGTWSLESGENINEYFKQLGNFFSSRIQIQSHKTNGLRLNK